MKIGYGNPGLPDQRMTFEQTKDWLDSLPAKTMEAGVYANDERVVFGYGLICRNEPFDIELAVADICGQFRGDFLAYLNAREGELYWCDPFEWDTWADPVITEYRDDGPDLDPITDRRCVRDKRFVAVKCYARCVKTESPPIKRDPNKKAYLGLPA